MTNMGAAVKATDCIKITYQSKEISIKAFNSKTMDRKIYPTNFSNIKSKENINSLEGEQILQSTQTIYLSN